MSLGPVDIYDVNRSQRHLVEAIEKRLFGAAIGRDIIENLFRFTH